MNYEVVAVLIPADPNQIQAFEQWLERLAQNGARLISVAPSVSTRYMLCIFSVSAPGVVGRTGPPGT
jgi:hypothetical protein